MSKLLTAREIVIYEDLEDAEREAISNLMTERKWSFARAFAFLKRKNPAFGEVR